MDEFLPSLSNLDFLDDIQPIWKSKASESVSSKCSSYQTAPSTVFSEPRMKDINILLDSDLEIQQGIHIKDLQFP